MHFSKFANKYSNDYKQIRNLNLWIWAGSVAERMRGLRLSPLTRPTSHHVSQLSCRGSSSIPRSSKHNELLPHFYVIDWSLQSKCLQCVSLIGAGIRSCAHRRPEVLDGFACRMRLLSPPRHAFSFPIIASFIPTEAAPASKLS